MQESCHLVVLDNRLAKDSPLYSTAIDPKSLTASMVSWVQKQKPILHLCLDHLSFCFSLSSFPNVKHLIIFWSSPSTMIILLLHHLAWDHPFMSTHLVQGLVPRFHQLSKTKLGLSISPFLVIDDNPFTKIFNKIFLDSCCLPMHITMCKGYGQVS